MSAVRLVPQCQPHTRTVAKIPLSLRLPETESLMALLDVPCIFMRRNPLGCLRRNSLRSLRRNPLGSLRRNPLGSLRRNSLRSLRRNRLGSLRHTCGRSKARRTFEHTVWRGWTTRGAVASLIDAESRELPLGGSATLGKGNDVT